jgi:hypothetical protein
VISKTNRWCMQGPGSLGEDGDDAMHSLYAMCAICLGDCGKGRQGNDGTRCPDRDRDLCGEEEDGHGICGEQGRLVPGGSLDLKAKGFPSATVGKDLGRNRGWPGSGAKSNSNSNPRRGSHSGEAKGERRMDWRQVAIREGWGECPTKDRDLSIWRSRVGESGIGKFEGEKGRKALACRERTACGQEKGGKKGGKSEERGEDGGRKSPRSPRRKTISPRRKGEKWWNETGDPEPSRSLREKGERDEEGKAKEGKVETREPSHRRKNGVRAKGTGIVRASGRRLGTRTESKHGPGIDRGSQGRKEGRPTQKVVGERRKRGEKEECNEENPSPPKESGKSQRKGRSKGEEESEPEKRPRKREGAKGKGKARLGNEPNGGNPTETDRGSGRRRKDGTRKGLVCR